MESSDDVAFSIAPSNTRLARAMEPSHQYPFQWRNSWFS